MGLLWFGEGVRIVALQSGDALGEISDSDWLWW